jgi:hypothetical protein
MLCSSVTALIWAVLRSLERQIKSKVLFALVMGRAMTTKVSGSGTCSAPILGLVTVVVESKIRFAVARHLPSTPSKTLGFPDGSVLNLSWAAVASLTAHCS